MREDHPYKAFFWMLLSGIAFSSMSALVRLMAGEIPALQIVFFRSTVNFLLVFVGMRILGEIIFPPNRGILLARGLVGSLGLCIYIYCLTQVPLSIASLLVNGSPIFILLLSRIFLKERLHPISIVWMAVALLGVGFILGNRGDGALFENWGGYGWAGYLCVLGAGVSGAAYTLVRAATYRFSNQQIVLYFAMISSIVSAPFLLFNYVSPTPIQWAYLVATGFLAWLAQYSLTQGFRSARAGISGSMTLLSPAIAVLWGVLFLDESLSFYQGIGMAILLFGLLQLTRIPLPPRATHN